MFAVALEDLVFAHVHFDVQVARRSAIAPGLAFTREANAITGIDTGGNLDRQALGTAHASLPQAGVAGILDDGAAAAALRARLLKLEEALRNAHLADAIAGFAGDRLVALGGAAATAGVALHELGDVDLDGMAEHGLAEVDLELVLEIRAAEHLRASAATAAAAENVAEHLAEHFAESVGARVAAPAALARRVDARMAMLVVDGALVRLAENFVGLFGFLEFLFRVFVARIAVRVIFHRKTTVGLLDVGFGRGARQIEHLVVIAFRHSRPWRNRSAPFRRGACSHVVRLSSCL